MIGLLTGGAIAIATIQMLWRDGRSQVAEPEPLGRPERTGDPDLSTDGPVSSALTTLGERSFDFVTALFDLGDEQRQDHLATLSAAQADPAAVDADSRELHKQLGVSVSALGVSVAGALIAPTLSLLSVPLLGYITFTRGKAAYETLRDEHRLSMSVLDMLIGLGVLANGLYITGSFAYVIVSGSMLLLKRTEASSRIGLINVFGERPRTAWLRCDEAEVEVPLEELFEGCEVVVRAGGQIPIDGVVVSGVATVDQQVLTGESLPIVCVEGDEVLASTTVIAGSLVIRVLRTGDATTAGQIGELLNRTADFELDVQLRGMKLADRSVLPTILLSGLALNVVGPNGAMAVLNSSLGWPLRVVTPLTLHGFLARISAQGILIKDGRVLELLGTIDTVVFDKTGTLTDGEPRITKVTSLSTYSEDEVLRYAAAAEHRQAHPIAHAILQAAAARGVTVGSLDDLRYEIGRGILGLQDGVEVRVGSEAFMRAGEIDVPDVLDALQRDATARGCALVMVAVGGRLVGALEWQPMIREEVHSLVAALKRRGMKTAVISGDREATTRRLCETLGVDEYHAEILPDGKAALIKQYQAAGRSVCFVGDGINDTLALKNADVSISLAGASSAAVDSAQVILMDGTLKHLEALLELTDEFKGVTDRNNVYAFAPGIVCLFGGFFLRMGLVSSLVVQVVGFSAGVRNARSRAGEREKPRGIGST